jgi:hypothetical protein
MGSLTSEKSGKRESAAVAVLRGCVCELLPGVGGEVVGVQGGGSSMGVQFVCHLNKRPRRDSFSTQALCLSCQRRRETLGGLKVESGSEVTDES